MQTFDILFDLTEFNVYDIELKELGFVAKTNLLLSSFYHLQSLKYEILTLTQANRMHNNHVMGQI